MTTRPYPNVRPAASGNGWEARHPRNGNQKHLGTFDTPEAARRAVLIAQAEHLEARAAIYRAEAEQFCDRVPMSAHDSDRVPICVPSPLRGLGRSRTQSQSTAADAVGRSGTQSR